MQAFSLETSIMTGTHQVNDLFTFIQDHATELDAYPMEQSIFSRLMKIGLTAMQCYFAAKGTGDVGLQVTLGNGKTFKRECQLRGKDYFSIFGKFKVPRTCYRKTGEPGIFPLDAQANLPKSCYSYVLQEWMDLFSIRDSFEDSSMSLEKLLGVKVYANRFEAIQQQSCMSYDQFYETRARPAPGSEKEITVMSFDGKGVPVIKREAARLTSRPGKGEKRQKKKEALVGVSYTIAPQKRTAEEIAKNLVFPEKKQPGNRKKEASSPTIRAQNIRRMASLERSKEEVVREIVGESQKRDSAHKRPWVVIMDGALSLWALIANVLGGISYVGILDIIHVTEYLWDVANTLYGENTSEGKQWVYEHLLLILKGRVQWVVGGLKRIQKEQEQQLKSNQRRVLQDTIRYFKNHQHWMHYDQYLNAGYPIGSGVVESTCGHTVKSRMEGTGRRWSIEGAEATLLLRSVYTSRDWESYWTFHMLLERSFYYHDTLEVLGIPDDYNELDVPEGHLFLFENSQIA